MSLELHQSLVKKRIYIASPLFSVAELEFNRAIKQQLSEYFEVFLPQEDGGLIIDLVKNGLSPASATRKVFNLDIGALDSCDLLLVVLDGRTIDEGAAFELGYAYAKGKRCYGLQTDVRRLLTYGNNPMIESACEIIFDSLEVMSKWFEGCFIKEVNKDFKMNLDNISVYV
jgi:nucleoside 2-deoxyribosyltransferase